MAGAIGGDYDEKVFEVAPMSDDEVRQLRVALRSPLPVVFFGRIVSAHGNEPIEGATIRVVCRTQLAEMENEVTLTPGETTVAIERSDRDGLFRLQYSPRLEPDAKIEASEWGCRYLALEKGHEGRSTAQRIELTRAAALRVLLIGEDGEPVPGVAIQLSTPAEMLMIREVPRNHECQADDLTWTSTTDSAGACELDGLPAIVPLHVRCTRAAHGHTQEREDIRLDPGEKRVVHWNWSE